jgi:hypothetical protein
MQHIYVDFNRGTSPDRIEVGYGDEAMLQGVVLREGERVVLHDDMLEVEGVLHHEADSYGKPYWFALADWTTRRDDEGSDIPLRSGQET